MRCEDGRVSVSKSLYGRRESVDSKNSKSNKLTFRGIIK